MVNFVKVGKLTCSLNYFFFSLCNGFFSSESKMVGVNITKCWWLCCQPTSSKTSITKCQFERSEKSHVWQYN